ncbi:hypothetical protein PHYSODRAFT_465331, partial [Phytophthora sojae]
KQNGKLADLETSTVQLRAEVAQLEENRNDISAAIQKKANMWNVAVEYLWLFRPDAQLDFVQKAMAADVACNDGFGRATAIRSWWFLQTTLTITEQTLQKLFPHLSTHTLASKLVGRRISMKGS